MPWLMWIVGGGRLEWICRGSLWPVFSLFNLSLRMSFYRRAWHRTHGEDDAVSYGMMLIESGSGERGECCLVEFRKSV